jgi:hypothetical protein
MVLLEQPSPLAPLTSAEWAPEGSPFWMHKMNGQIYRLLGAANLDLESLNAPICAFCDRLPTHSTVPRTETVLRGARLHEWGA